MNAAVLGVDLSAFTCTLGLQKRNIEPVLFGLEEYLQSIPLHSCFVPRTRVNLQSLQYLKGKYGISFRPSHTVGKIIVRNECRTMVNRGNLGFLFSRGMKKESMELRIAELWKYPLRIESPFPYDKLPDEFERIIACSGGFAFEYRRLEDAYCVRTRVANVLGHFETDTIRIWFNRDITQSGYCMLIPVNENMAEFILVSLNASYLDMDMLWNSFLNFIGVGFTIAEERNYSYTYHIGNTIRRGVVFSGGETGISEIIPGVGTLGLLELGFAAAAHAARYPDGSIEEFLAEKWTGPKPVLKCEISKIRKIERIINDPKLEGADRIPLLLGLLGFMPANYPVKVVL